MKTVWYCRDKDGIVTVWDGTYERPRYYKSRGMWEKPAKSNAKLLDDDQYMIAKRYGERKRIKAGQAKLIQLKTASAEVS